MKTQLQNQQTVLQIQTSPLNILFRWLLMQALNSVPDREFSSVTLHLLDDEKITDMNRAVFDRNKPTDVIALTYDPIPGTNEDLEGEIFVNIERAVQCQGNPLPLPQEIALYIAHGCDHLAGHEDDTEEKKDAMLTTNHAWVHQALEEGHLEGLIKTS